MFCSSQPCSELRNYSQFFRDMPDHDEKLCGASPSIVQFDVDPAPFALLLNMIDNRIIDTPHTWPEYAAVIELGVKYGFIHLVPLFLRYTKSNKPIGNPWFVFVVASRHDIPELARWALANFDDSQFWARYASTITPKDMEQLSGKYATAFIRALKGSRNDGQPSRWLPRIDGRGEHGQHNDWLEISRKLDLKNCRGSIMCARHRSYC